MRDVVAKDGHEILEGQLQCSGCERAFPIVRGVPRFANLAEIEIEKAKTALSFGWQWKHFTHHDEKYKKQFLGWLRPVRPEFFKNKIVLDGGCGKGRHVLLAAEWGAREVIGIDLSEAVDTAFAATRGAENIHIVQGDICRLPFAQVFDYAFSLGVIMILGNPVEGFNSLAAKVKPGGHLSVWVYGAENNRWITSFVSPMRSYFTSRLNPQTLLHLSKLPTAILYLVTRLGYRPLNKIGKSSLGRRLFYGEYLSALSDFGWREHHTIVFDHLVAPTAHYISREEFEKWWAGIEAQDVTIGWHNKNSWRGFGHINNFRPDA